MTDLFSANFCLSTSPLYGILEMLFEVDELHVYREASKIFMENKSFKERKRSKGFLLNWKCFHKYIMDDTEVIGQGRMAKLFCAQDKLCMGGKPLETLSPTSILLSSTNQSHINVDKYSLAFK